ncbi:hypothetical protein ACWGJX_46500 [Streptomyces sp. NPDC054775]
MRDVGFTAALSAGLADWVMRVLPAMRWIPSPGWLIIPLTRPRTPWQGAVIGSADGRG